MNCVISMLAGIILATVLLCSGESVSPEERVHKLKITVLSTMLAEADALGEWGFAALVEVDGRRLLFDTGSRPDTVLSNAASMKIDLSGIEDVVLSHNHGDHTGGLAWLRKELRAKNEHALARAHVAPQIFWPRFENGEAWTSMQKTKQAYESEGGHFEVHGAPFKIAPGVWFTGPIPRKFPERNYPPGIVVRAADGSESEDTLPEDSALIFNTESGLVVLSGCGHAGIVNTVAYARQVVSPDRIAALIGGFHLFAADDAHLKWTASKLKEFKVDNLLGAHCTGIEAVYQLRNQLGLARTTAIVAAVGSSYTLDGGLSAGGLGLAK